MATGTMKSGLEIAQEAKLRPITEIAAAAGLEPQELEAAGTYRGKVRLSILDRLRGRTHERQAGDRHGHHADKGRRGQNHDERGAHDGARQAAEKSDAVPARLGLKA